MKQWFREPLLHFLLLGIILFAAYHFMERGRGSAEPSKQIQLSLDELAQLAVLFQSQWRRDPTPEEFSRLVENRVQEEVLYREALAMGLDKGDTIVKRRMAQKHGFGFASALTGAGLPRSDLPLALVSFNVGVELGQLGFVALVLSLEHSFRILEVRWPRWTQALPGYTVGSLGAYWTIQRTVMLFGGLR